MKPVPPPTPVRWTRSQCEALVDAEILTGRYELIDGEILSKMGQKPPHRATVTLVAEWLQQVFGIRRWQAQGPIDVSEEDNAINEPEPDGAGLRRPTTEIMSGNPAAYDVLLAVEVADTSLRFGLRVKAPLYARAAIPEYWVIDIIGRRLFVHRDPTSGGYATILEYSEHESVAPLAKPNAVTAVSELLPPVQAEGMES